MIHGSEPDWMLYTVRCWCAATTRARHASGVQGHCEMSKRPASSLSATIVKRVDRFDKCPRLSGKGGAQPVLPAGDGEAGPSTPLLLPGSTQAPAVRVGTDTPDGDSITGALVSIDLGTSHAVMCVDGQPNAELSDMAAIVKKGDEIEVVFENDTDLFHDAAATLSAWKIIRGWSVKQMDLTASMRPRGCPARERVETICNVIDPTRARVSIVDKTVCSLNICIGI